MEFPQGIDTKKGIRNNHSLKLLNNIYGQQQVFMVCNFHLAMDLEEIGLNKSRVDD